MKGELLEGEILLVWQDNLKITLKRIFRSLVDNYVNYRPKSSDVRSGSKFCVRN